LARFKELYSLRVLFVENSIEPAKATAKNTDEGEKAAKTGGGNKSCSRAETGVRKSDRRGTKEMEEGRKCMSVPGIQKSTVTTTRASRSPATANVFSPCSPARFTPCERLMEISPAWVRAKVDLK